MLLKPCAKRCQDMAALHFFFAASSQVTLLCVPTRCVPHYVLCPCASMCTFLPSPSLSGSWLHSCQTNTKGNLFVGSNAAKEIKKATDTCECVRGGRGQGAAQMGVV